MEDVLSVYVRPHDENRPVVYMDEKPFHLLGDARGSIPMRQGKLECGDFEYLLLANYAGDTDYSPAGKTAMTVQLHGDS